MFLPTIMVRNMNSNTNILFGVALGLIPLYGVKTASFLLGKEMSAAEIQADQELLHSKLWQPDELRKFVQSLWQKYSNSNLDLESELRMLGAMMNIQLS